MRKTESRERRCGTRKKGWLVMLLVILLLMSLAVSICIGTVSVSFGDLIHALGREPYSMQERVLRYVRIPRVCGAALAGMGLAVSGTIIQTILGNPLAGPNIIGVNSGAGFSVVLFSALFPDAYNGMPLAAFAGALITVLVVYKTAEKTGSSKITIVLAGVAINSMLSAATDVVYTFCSESLTRSNGFRIGGLNGVNTKVLIPASIAILTAVFLAFCLHNELEVLSLGEDTAHSLGLPVRYYRFLFLVLAAVLAGASVSFAGLLGFVGLIIPHAARILSREEGRYQIVISALLGAVFLVICDLLARTLFQPFELPVGIVLSFIGSPCFIYLLFRQRRRS
ncbi:MAG: iron ABC transporter permease [Clostridiales bacterium]|nr:iron ABC transporter permease [Clostridiales bacterium]